MAEKMSPFDIVKNINGHSARLDTDDVGYDAFVINKIYSNTPDSVAFANELNQNWALPKQQQYDFYRFGLPKNMRRFGKWEKRSTDTAEDLKQIQEAYGYSRQKAIEVYPILVRQMDKIRALNDKGGKR